MTEKLDGVIVAAALPYAEDATAPRAAPRPRPYAAHCRWLVENGRRGVGRTLARRVLADRRRAPGGREGRGSMPSATTASWFGCTPGAHQARYCGAAAEDGAHGVLCLPPTMYRANRGEVLHHYAEVAGGLRCWSTTTRSTPRST